MMNRRWEGSGNRFRLQNAISQLGLGLNSSVVQYIVKQSEDLQNDKSRTLTKTKSSSSIWGRSRRCQKRRRDGENRRNPINCISEHYNNYCCFDSSSNLHVLVCCLLLIVMTSCASATTTRMSDGASPSGQNETGSSSSTYARTRDTKTGEYVMKKYASQGPDDDEVHDDVLVKAVLESLNMYYNKRNSSNAIEADKARLKKFDQVKGRKGAKKRVKRDEEMVCYGPVLGCFRDEGPFDYLDMLPSPPEEINTRFLFYSTSNVNPETPLVASYFNFTSPAVEYLLRGNSNNDNVTFFNASLPTKVIIHGFGSTCLRMWATDMRNAFFHVFHESGLNIICVDWENGAALPNYVRAAVNTRLVGKQVSLLIRWLIDISNNNKEESDPDLTPGQFHLIGFSLGAHVAGFAGQEVKNVSRITGLDPAGPLFESYDPKVRLDQSDAMFVDVIHSNGESLIMGGLGSWEPMGHVDFYPNGGRVQKGCSNLFLGAVRDLIWSAAATASNTVGGSSSSSNANGNQNQNPPPGVNPSFYSMGRFSPNLPSPQLSAVINANAPGSLQGNSSPISGPSPRKSPQGPSPALPLLPPSSDTDGRSLCNHRRAYKFFTESVYPQCSFPAFACESYDKYLTGACFANWQDPSRVGLMGFYADKDMGLGIQYYPDEAHHPATPKVPGPPANGPSQQGPNGSSGKTKLLYLVTREEEPFCANQYRLTIESTPSTPPMPLSLLPIPQNGGTSPASGPAASSQIPRDGLNPPSLVPPPPPPPPGSASVPISTYGGLEAIVIQDGASPVGSSSAESNLRFPDFESGRSGNTGDHLLDGIMGGGNSLNESFLVTQSQKDNLVAGSILHRLVVLHPLITSPGRIQLKYSAYQGWLYSGISRWSVDRVILTNAFGRSFSFCANKGTPSHQIHSGSGRALPPMKPPSPLHHHHMNMKSSSAGLLLPSGVPVTLTLTPGICNGGAGSPVHNSRLFHHYGGNVQAPAGVHRGNFGVNNGNNNNYAQQINLTEQNNQNFVPTTRGGVPGTALPMSRRPQFTFMSSETTTKNSSFVLPLEYIRRKDVVESPGLTDDESMDEHGDQWKKSGTNSSPTLVQQQWQPMNVVNANRSDDAYNEDQEIEAMLTKPLSIVSNLNSNMGEFPALQFSLDEGAGQGPNGNGPKTSGRVHLQQLDEDDDAGELFLCNEEDDVDNISGMNGGAEVNNNGDNSNRTARKLHPQQLRLCRNRTRNQSSNTNSLNKPDKADDDFKMMNSRVPIDPVTTGGNRYSVHLPSMPWRLGHRRPVQAHGTVDKLLSFRSGRKLLDGDIGNKENNGNNKRFLPLPRSRALRPRPVQLLSVASQTNKNNKAEFLLEEASKSLTGGNNGGSLIFVNGPPMHLQQRRLVSFGRLNKSHQPIIGETNKSHFTSN